MPHQIAFPMYDLHRADSKALIRAVQTLLVKRGWSAESLLPVWPQESLFPLWRSDALLLSQTCGFPLVTQLPQVQVVGAFHYSAPGCAGVHYRSFLVVRREDQQRQLVDFRGRRVVCNSIDSQSGYNVLLRMIAPLATDGRFFSHALFSGSHRQSLIELQKGTADIAAIDCISWALLERHQPALLAGLAIIEQSPQAPGLPLITAGQTSAQTLALLRDVLHELVSAPDYRAVCDALFIQGVGDVSREDYALLLDWRNAAANSGVTQL